MLDLMSDRGPDGPQIVDRGGFTAGFSLLAIVGPVDNRVQPVEVGPLVAGMNGEIYNYKDLARRHRLDSSSLVSDAQILPFAYRDAGFPDSLDGMFAGFVFDADRQRLTLFRDHVGIKPMYFARTHGSVVFGSILLAVSAAAGLGTVDATALHSYLRRGYPPADRPLVAGVEVVPPGTVVTFDGPDSTPTLRRWFEVAEPVPTTSRPFSLEGLTRSVLQEVPDRLPPTVALSGGVDSTTVALILRQAGHDPVTLSVDYDCPDSKTTQDQNAVARLVDDFHLANETVRIDRASVVAEVGQPWRFDVPIADPNAISLSRLARMTTDLGSRVMLTGDGADELFAGYPYHVAAARPFPLGYLQARLGGRMEEPADRRFAWRLTHHWRPREVAPTGADPVRAVLLDDLERWLEPNLLTKTDRFAMAESVEVRVPFLRPWIVRAAFDLPTTALVADGVGKHVLRTTVAGLVPDYVLQRRKVGFSAPLDAWLGMPDTWDLAEDTAQSLSLLLDPATVLALWREHLVGRRQQGQQLWRLAVLRSWLAGLSRAQRLVTPLARIASPVGLGR